MIARKRRSDRALRAESHSPGRPGVARREDRRRFWALIAAGQSSEDAAIGAGVSQAVGSRWFREAGGMPAIDARAVIGTALGAVPVVRGARGDRAVAGTGPGRAGDRPAA